MRRHGGTMHIAKKENQSEKAKLHDFNFMTF